MMSQTRSKRDERHSAEDAGDASSGIAFAERKGAVPEQAAWRARTSRGGARLFSLAVFVAGFLAGFCIASACLGIDAGLLAGLLVGIVATMAIHISLQWEKVVILRFGRFDRVAGPGVYFTIPIVEYATLRVDQRMRCTYFSGEKILTADLVPVNVDAVFYWTVWDAKKVSTEVEDYLFSVANAAQTCLRDVIGGIELEELATRRSQIDSQVRDQIAELTEPWGVSVTTVKLRDIVVPEELQDALSKAAQAQRERDARMIMAEVEGDIAEMLVSAADIYDKNQHALQLRTIQAASEGSKNGKGLIIVPNALADSLGKTEDFLARL